MRAIGSATVKDNAIHAQAPDRAQPGSDTPAPASSRSGPSAVDATRAGQPGSPLPIELPVNRRQRVRDARSRLLENSTGANTLARMAERFARELADVFDAAHVAVSELRDGSPVLIAVSSGLAPQTGISGDLPDAAASQKLYVQLAAGEPRIVLTLAASPAGSPDGQAYRAGLMSLAQVAYYAIDGTLAGAITVGSVAEHDFSLEDGEHLTDLAQTFTLMRARQAARLLREPVAGVAGARAQPTSRWVAVAEVLAGLGATETIDDVALPVALTILELFSGEECCIAISRGERLEIVARADTEGGHAHADETTSRCHMDSPRVAAAFGTEADLHQAALPGLGAEAMRSEMFARIGPDETPLGLVTVWSRNPGEFTQEDARELHRAVQPLGAVLHYFEGRRRAEERARQLEKVNRVLSSLSGSGAPAELSQQFLSQCRRMLGAEMAAIIHFDQDSSEGEVIEGDCGAWDVAFPARLPLSHLDGPANPPGENTIALAASSDGAPARFANQLEALGLYSTVRVPLIVKGVPIGAITLWGEGTKRFSDDDADLLAAVTGPFALALEKAAALESLAESERRYRTLVSRAEEMIFLFDADTRMMLDGNAFAARTLGYTEAEFLGLRVDDFFEGDPSLLASDVQALVSEGELHITERRYRRRDGSSLEVDIVASAITYEGHSAILALARDVSEHKSLQRQLVQSQKMESLGSMAGMVAHDFNNLLTTILGFAGLLKRSGSFDGEERENLSMIEEAARRAADLTGRLLSFARGGLARFGPVDLREVVNDTLSLAQTAIQQSIRLSTDLPAGPLVVEGDSGQLQSALLNVVLNAKDAMPDGGELRIALREHADAAMLTISDTGMGMDDETRTRIFEPFYTTKPLGSGTGLGMAITYGIVQGHHGGIAVHSAPGAGTTFELTFPILREADVSSTEPAGGPSEGTLILIVDDDEMVRRSMSATLAQLGYSVVQAASGATAIELVRARPDRFAAILLDLVMPGLTGSETFRAISALRADIPVIICTGYAAEAHIDSDVKRRIAGLLQKPFAVERLAVMLTGVGAPPHARRRGEG